MCRARNSQSAPMKYCFTAVPRDGVALKERVSVSRNSPYYEHEFDSVSWGFPPTLGWKNPYKQKHISLFTQPHQGWRKRALSCYEQTIYFIYTQTYTNGSDHPAVQPKSWFSSKPIGDMTKQFFEHSHVSLRFEPNEISTKTIWPLLNDKNQPITHSMHTYAHTCSYTHTEVYKKKMVSWKKHMAYQCSMLFIWFESLVVVNNDTFIRYKFLAFDFDENVELSGENCRLLMIRLKMEGWTIGKTKIFLKYYNEEYLSRLYETHVKKIIKIQSLLRGFLVKCRLKKVVTKQEEECSKVKLS